MNLPWALSRHVHTSPVHLRSVFHFEKTQDVGPPTHAEKPYWIRDLRGCSRMRRQVRLEPDEVKVTRS